MAAHELPALLAGDLAGAMTRAERSALCLAAAGVKTASADVCTVVEDIMVDEETGRPIKLAPVHREWHRLLEEHDRLVLWAPPESGKTTTLVGRILWTLGMDPTRRIAFGSRTDDLASKVVRAVKTAIESNRAYRARFPHVLPGTPWTDTAIAIQRPHAIRDPSLQGFGLTSSIVGSRVDDLYLDDLLDHENTRTPHRRAELWGWLHDSKIMGRLTRRGRLVLTGTAYLPDDVMHAAAKKSGWVGRRFPVIGEDGHSIVPQIWSDERIARARRELLPVEFARQLMCVARDDAASRFKEEWITACLSRGRGRPQIESFTDGPPPGCVVYAGVDIGVSRKVGADMTVIFVVLIWPNGDHEVLEVQAGRWKGPEIIRRIQGVGDRYGAVVLVENNAAQDFVLQFTAEAGNVTVLPFTTGRNKSDPAFGVESLAADMAAERWVIPCGPDLVPSAEVQLWISEMLFYSPERHSGDRLMASWIAREGARRRRQPEAVAGAGVMVIG